MQQRVDLKAPGCCSFPGSGIPSLPLDLNLSFLQNVPGGFKIAHTTLGMICLAVIAHFCQFFHPLTGSSLGLLCSGGAAYFLLVSFAFFVTSLTIVVCCVLSHFTASFLPKTAFEFGYHLLACVMYLSSSLILLIGLVGSDDGDFKEPGFEGKVAASVLGLINAVLYGVSTYFSFQSHRQMA